MKKVYLLLLILLGVHLFLLFNLKFTAWPEMVSFPFFSNHGYTLYKDMLHAYPPILTIFLSIIYKFFGYRLIVVKIVTWLIIIANDVLIFFIVQKVTKSVRWSVISVLCYVLVQPFLEGNMLWYDLAIVPTILLATLAILDKKYFLAGLFFAFAALTKQNTALFLIFSAFYLVYIERNIKKLLFFLIGPFSIGVVFMVKLITESSLMDFFNWTLIYPARYWTNFPGYVQMDLSHRQLLVFISLCLPALFVFLRRRSFLLIIYFLLSCVLIYPRFSFFHFQAGIAFAAILFGQLLSRSKKRLIPPALLFIALFIVVSFPVFKTDWRKESRFWGKEEIKTAQLISNSTKSDDLIYLLGPQSALYVFANRLPPKPWADNYSWFFEIPGVQEEIIKRWDTNKPKVVFTTNIQEGNWYDLGTYRPQKIVGWIEKEKIDEISLY